MLETSKAYEKESRRQEDTPHDIRFIYERLGPFCYVCGHRGHIAEYCATLFFIPEDNGKRY